MLGSNFFQIEVQNIRKLNLISLRNGETESLYPR